jgi:hypothetical protein
VITITDTGTTVLQTGQGPYDGSDDTLVGVVNNGSKPITSIKLSSALQIFGFDGDGLVVYGIPGNDLDPTGYGGPNAYFPTDMISADATSGTVSFIAPIPPGGTSYFSLENALASAYSCADIINGSVSTVANAPSNGNIDATFAPKLGLSVAQAAQFCGFTALDWTQTTVHVSDPFPFTARNIGGAFLASASGPVHITSAMTPYNDPPPGGGYTYETPPDFSAPFYYNTTTELPNQISPDGLTLGFHDAPGDQCLPGGAGVGQAVCNFSSAPSGSYQSYVTHLAGVNADGTATDLGVGFSYNSDWSGTSGGVATTKTNAKADPGTGTGGVAVTSVSETTNYSYSGVAVTGINGGAGTATLLFGTQLSATQYNLPFPYKGSEVSLSVVLIRNLTGQTLKGPFNVVFSSLPVGASLQSVLFTPKVGLAAPSGVFGGFPYATAPGDLAAGGVTAVTVVITNPGTSAASYTPLTYAGAFN